jgi:hypothetical protein
MKKIETDDELQVGQELGSLGMNQESAVSSLSWQEVFEDECELK